MKVDGGLFAGDLARVPERTRAQEDLGYDGLITAEVSSDPFLPLVLAAEHSERLDLITSIAVAFARNPMTLAQLGHDLNQYSKGRFILGLGSQIAAHITKRFSMPWSHPAPRMRELILAMRAIWDCWYQGRALDFRGDYYQHTLMTPMFTPQNVATAAPRVLLAAVGPKMTEVAAEAADGIICHGFTTERYLREVTLPALERGLVKAGKERNQIQVTCPVFIVTGQDEEAFAESKQAVRAQIAFYASTPAYRPVLEVHGWGELQSELRELTKTNRWSEMADRIDDEILGAFAVVAEPDGVAEGLRQRFGGCLDRIVCTASLSDSGRQRELIESIRKIPSGADSI